MLDVSIHRLTWRCGHGVVAIKKKRADVESWVLSFVVEFDLKCFNSLLQR
jgi:hypothetical protein